MSGFVEHRSSKEEGLLDLGIDKLGTPSPHRGVLTLSSSSYHTEILMSEDDVPVAGFFLFFKGFFEPEECESLLEKKCSSESRFPSTAQ